MRVSEGDAPGYTIFKGGFACIVIVACPGWSVAKLNRYITLVSGIRPALGMTLTRPAVTLATDATDHWGGAPST